MLRQNITFIGMWASAVRVVEAGGSASSVALYLAQGEACVAAAVVRWGGSSDHTLVLAVAHDTLLAPRLCTKGSLHVYKVHDIYKFKTYKFVL